MNGQFRNILSSDPLLDIPTDPEELANLLDTYSVDWGSTLSFLHGVAKQKGIEIDRKKVIDTLVRKYKESENE